MAKLEIELIGSPVLKQPGVPIDKVDKSVRALIDDMKETMYAHDGVGLAAPQVGQSLRLFVIDDGNGFEAYINPVITEKSEETDDLSEGCLSIPGIIGVVERHCEVTVEYTNRWGKRKTKKASGLLAQAIQHENDHIDGILFVERAKTLYETKDED